MGNACEGQASEFVRGQDCDDQRVCAKHAALHRRSGVLHKTLGQPADMPTDSGIGILPPRQEVQSGLVEEIAAVVALAAGRRG